MVLEDGMNVYDGEDTSGLLNECDLKDMYKRAAIIRKGLLGNGFFGFFRRRIAVVTDLQIQDAFSDARKNVINGVSVDRITSSGGRIPLSDKRELHIYQLKTPYDGSRRKYCAYEERIGD